MVIATKVVAMLREAILEMLGSIRIELIVMFDECYFNVTDVAAVVTITVVATARPLGVGRCNT